MDKYNNSDIDWIVVVVGISRLGVVIIIYCYVRLAFVCIIYNLWITCVKIVDKYTT